MKRYEDEKDNILALLRKVKSRISLTTDMWTASNQRKGYMAVTSHFIDNAWKLQSRIIRYYYQLLIVLVLTYFTYLFTSDVIIFFY